LSKASEIRHFSIDRYLQPILIPNPFKTQNLGETQVGGVLDVDSLFIFSEDNHMPLPAKGSIRELANAAALRRRCKPLAGASPSSSLAAIFGNLNPIPTTRRPT
jgi:hypothetical protein